jgi:tetratricopeptide (TPR) repeat protein
MAESQKNDMWNAIAMGTHGTILGDDEKEKKLNCYLESLKIFEKLDDVQKNITAVCANIAGVYSNIGNYEKAYESIKRALELAKERNAFYEIAKAKIDMARIYYVDPQKSVSDDLIINCLKEALETYEKIGHVRGTAEVLSEIGEIYANKQDLESAVANFERAATVHSSLNEQYEEAKLNLSIGFCYANLGDLSNAKSYFEKSLLSGHCTIAEKLSLVEVYLNEGDYNEAFSLTNKLITEESEGISDDERYLALLFMSISSLLLNKEEVAYECLKKIGEFNSEKVTIDWDFSDIEPVLDKPGECKQLFIDAITLLKGEIKYPIIRLKDVKILKEELWKQAEIFHPFTGSFTLTKDDEDLKEIMGKLSHGEKIDFDTPEILGIKRNKALLILGFLFRKGFLDCEKMDGQKFDLKLTEIGLKVLGLRGGS